MKKIILIILLALVSFVGKSQEFGIKSDLGASWQKLPKHPFGNLKVKPSLYYSLGLFYSLKSKPSSIGLNICLDYNKRGFRTEFVSNSDEALYYYNSFSDSHSTQSRHSLSLTISPTINLSKRIEFIFGPHLTYSLGYKQTGTTNYYSDQNRTKLISSQDFNESYNGESFYDRLSYGVKFGFNIMVSKKIDLGASYQYSRKMKYPEGLIVPKYHIFSFTTSLYLKSRG